MNAAIMLDDTPAAIPVHTGPLYRAANGIEDYAASEPTPFASTGLRGRPTCASGGCASPVTAPVTA